MACSACYTNPCSCSYQQVDCPCEDPGMETVGKHLVIKDGQFCDRRLQNPDGTTGGFLFYSGNGFRWGNDPRVVLGALEVAEEQLFGELVITRANGLLQRVTPANGVDGVLKADGSGNLSFVDISSSFTLPDPLVVTTINVTNLNTTDIVVSGTPEFSGLQDDTIVSNIGLNAANELVKGSSPTISVASFFESNDPANPTYPNYTFAASPTSAVQIGVQIADPDGLAHAGSLSSIVIDVAGDYIISWRGNYVGYNPGTAGAGSIFNPGLWLRINSIVVDRGSEVVYQDRHLGGWVGGEYLALAVLVGDVITLTGNGSMRINNDDKGRGLQNVGVILKKYN